jgi:aldose 1-epimerase
MIYTDQYRFRMKKITTITVTNSKNLKVVFCSMGASIYKAYIGNKKITYGPRYLVDFLYDSHFYGKTAGRTAGRIKDGIIFVRGKKYKLSRPKIHSLHGGYGFSFKNYSYEYGEDNNEYFVKFKYVSLDKEKGYPGKLVNIVIYHIPKDKDEIILEFKAISSKDTVCNLTNHTYWNLNGIGNANILLHTLQINASHYVKINEDLLKEDILPVDQVFDFRKGKQVYKDIEEPSLQKVAKGYDHDWIIDNPNLDTPSLVVTSDTGELVLNVYTTNPVCHLYTNNYLEGKEKYSAIAIEMQRRIFDIDKGAVDLKANESYHEITRYEFKLK